MEILLANNVDPYQTPHDVASDLGLHCLPMAPGKNGLISNGKGKQYRQRTKSNKNKTSQAI